MLRDINRRKSNVVISGLPEPSGNESDIRAADLNTFCRLCEEHLDMKPGVSRLGCKRLGKPADYTDKPRKLLVYLNSDSAASSLLKSAKQLRKSDDPYIATHVFIKQDLSPADSKIAYEERERLRHIRAQKSRSNRNTQPPVAESGGSSAPLGNSNTAISQPSITSPVDVTVNTDSDTDTSSKTIPHLFHPDQRTVMSPFS